MKNVAIFTGLLCSFISIYGCGGDEFTASTPINVNTGGQNTGGFANDAGGSNTGGNITNTGGVNNTGGAINTGGSVSTGGNNNTGGEISTGGMNNTGGVNNTGGYSNTGGVNNTGGNNNTGGSLPSECAGKTIYTKCESIILNNPAATNGMYCIDAGLGYDPISVYCDFIIHPSYTDGSLINDYGKGFTLVYHSSIDDACTKESLSLNIDDVGYLPINYIQHYIITQGAILIVKDNVPFMISLYQHMDLSSNLLMNKNINDKKDINAWVYLNVGLSVDNFNSGPLTDSYPDIFSVNYIVNTGKHLKVTTNTNGGVCASTFGNNPVDIKVFVK